MHTRIEVTVRSDTIRTNGYDVWGITKKLALTQWILEMLSIITNNNNNESFAIKASDFRNTIPTKASI